MAGRKRKEDPGTIIAAGKTRCSASGIQQNEDILGYRNTDEELNVDTCVWPKSSRHSPSGSKRKATDDQQDEKLKQSKKARKIVTDNRKTQEREEAKRSIQVGIDFGTTYSGIGYVSASDPRGSAEAITKWSGGENLVQEKVPTRVAYGIENGLLQDYFGYDVTAKMKCCEWFKLALDSSTRHDGLEDALLSQSQGQGLMHCPPDTTYADIVQDFLAWLYKHTLESFRGFLGSALDETPLHFHITVPAMWNYAAREATKQAAERAGFGRRHKDSLILTDEPEAAAIYALSSSCETFAKTLFGAGKTIIVADFGGGTLDVVSYKIVQVKPLRLIEACVGDGAKYGGTTIDRNLHALLNDRFGDAFASLSHVKKGAGSTFMEAFERIKRNFNSEQLENVLEVPLKMKILSEDDSDMEEWYDFEEDQVRLSGIDLANMFDPVIQAGTGLLRGQYQGISDAGMPRPKAIVLCGGLGSSKYVMEKITAFCRKELNNKIEVIGPQRPWSSVQRGAALRGIGTPPVMYRFSRDFIGILVHEKFIDGQHDEEDAYYDSNLQEKRARNQFKCEVERGEKIKPNMRKKIECFHIVAKNERKLIIKIRQGLYSCTDTVMPKRKNERVYKIGDIEIDLTRIVAELRKDTKKNPAGRKNLEIPITIELHMGSDKGVLDVSAMVGRRKVGRTQIEYEADPTVHGSLIGKTREGG